MNTRSLNREILDIGVPSFLETLFTTFAAIIDSKMVAVMGVSAISAVSGYFLPQSGRKPAL